MSIALCEPATNDQEVPNKTFHVLVPENGGKPPTKFNSSPYSPAQFASVLGALPFAILMKPEATPGTHRETTVTGAEARTLVSAIGTVCGTPIQANLFNCP